MMMMFRTNFIEKWNTFYVQHTSVNLALSEIMKQKWGHTTRLPHCQYISKLVTGVHTLQTIRLLYKSRSKSCYDWRSVGLSLLASSPMWGSKPDFCYCKTVAGLLMWGALSNERTGLSFKIAGPRQRSHSRVGVPHVSWPYFTVSDSRFPNLEGQIPVFISPRNRVATYTPGHWFLFFFAFYDSKSQSYFMTGGLMPVSSSWCQAPWGSRPEFFICNWTLAVIVLM
jgi:hypothetical protein